MSSFWRKKDSHFSMSIFYDFVFLVCIEIAIPLLRQQQIRLGLLKAARTIFSQQENLQQIMSHPGHHDDDSEYSLFQQLLSAATRPSPIKAMFGRDELEV